MNFQQTSALNLNELLIALRDFLFANGWTIPSDGTGSGGLNLTVRNSNNHDFYLSSTTEARTDVITGALTDRLLNVNWDKAAIGLAAGASARVAKTNDMAGPFANVWFISDEAATYCHIIAQSATNRYSHTSFGNLDPKGMHSTPLPFAVGVYWQWWRTNSNPNDPRSKQNDPSDGDHEIGYFCEDSGSGPSANTTRVGIPDGLLDPALFFDDGALEMPALQQTCSRDVFFSFSSAQPQRLLDYQRYILNQTVTGGAPITPLPVAVIGTTNSLHAFVGVFPGVGAISIRGLSPGQVLTFAGEEWIVFPLKQIGNVVNANNGGQATLDCNSAFYGLAYKKADAP